MSDSFSNLRFKVQSSVQSFKESTYQKFCSFNYAKHFLDSSLGLNENNCTFFELCLKNSSAILQAQIILHQDYPRQTPLFALNVNWKYDRNFTNDEAIRDMEREINIYKDNFCLDEETNGTLNSCKKLRKSFSTVNRLGLDDNMYDIFGKQVNHLLICFDIYLESEAYFLNDFEFQRSKLFPSTVRGRDRKRPYSYLASRDLFMQRMQSESN